MIHISEDLFNKITVCNFNINLYITTSVHVYASQLSAENIAGQPVKCCLVKATKDLCILK
jgi:hypothetical protein